MTRNIPTPAATVTMRTVPSILGTFFARTCRSGSETVIIIPRRKLRSTISRKRRERVSAPPMCDPICVIDTSAPIVNIAIPTMTINAPIKNESMSPLSIGTKKKQRTATISVIGTTDATDSRSFSLKTFRLLNENSPKTSIHILYNVRE